MVLLGTWKGKLRKMIEQKTEIYCGMPIFMVPLLINSFVAAGGREKAPAAFSRKPITSTDKFEMWGDGKKTRSFTFIDECVEGVLRYMLGMAFHFIVRPYSCNLFLQIHLIYSTKSLTYFCSRLTKSDFREPVNIGSDEMVSMNEMAEIVLSFENKKLPIHHIPGPEGVRGRNSDNTLIKEKLGWAPTMKLKVRF